MNGFTIFPKINNYIEITDVPISITKKEHQVGLMEVFTPSFMVFLYKEACLPRFWMKNTPLPLDIIFCNVENNISHIKNGKPFDENVIKINSLCKSIIEAPVGFCKYYGIDLGDKVKIKYDKSILYKILDTWR